MKDPAQKGEVRLGSANPTTECGIDPGSLGPDPDLFGRATVLLPSEAERILGQRKWYPISRAEFFAFVDESGLLPEVVRKLLAKAAEGDLSAAKYVVDQRFGGPKTTTIIELSAAQHFEAIMRATARWTAEHGIRELYPLWLSAVQQEIAKLGSESKTSSDED